MCKKIYIKGKIKVVIGLLVLGFMTVTLLIRLYGMSTYDWYERGNYFMMSTHKCLYNIFPGEQSVELKYRIDEGESARYQIVSKEFSVSGISDTNLLRCLVLGYPTVKEGITKFETEGILVSVISNGEFEFDGETKYSNEEKEKAISKLKSVFKTLSIAETIIILIRLVINLVLIKILLKYFVNSIKEDLEGIEPL